MKLPKLSHVALFLVWMLTMGAAGVSLNHHYVVEKAVMNAGVAEAEKAIESNRCKQAFIAENVRYRTMDLPDLFSRTKAVPAMWLWPPNANGIAHCDVSGDTYMVSTARAMWGGPHQLAKTHVHEFVHLLDCEKLRDTFGSQTRMGRIANGLEGNYQQQVQALAFIREMEAKAYRVGALCVGDPVPGFAKKKKEKEKKHAIPTKGN